MKKVFTYIAILFAAVCTMPATAYGADDETGSVELSKKVKDNQDGTYTLTLESFVTGETVQKLVTQPCDIVLVLDNTSSMYKTNMDGSSRSSASASGSRIEALINAIASDGGFIDQIYDSAKKGNVSHNISIVEFKGGIPRGSQGDYKPSTSNGAWWTNHDLVFWDSDLYYKYGGKPNGRDVPVTSTMGEWADDNLSDWMAISGENTSEKESIKNAINKKGGIFDYCPRSTSGANGEDGGTPSGSALVRAGQLLNVDGIKNDNHPKIVIFFTDGQCGYDAEWNQWNRAMACEVIKQANLLKKDNVTIYSIGTFGSDSNNDDTNGYLNHVSSKFKTEVTTKNGRFVYDNTDVSPTAAADNEYVFLASNQEALAEAFKKISQKVKEASEAYDLDDKSAVVLDVLTHMFKLPKGTDKTQINLYTCDVVTNNLSEKVKWVDTGVTTGGNKIVNKDADNNIIDDSAAGDHKEYWVKIDDNTAASMTEIQGVDDEEIYVTGFNYAKNYVGIVKEGGQIKGWHNPGKKLIIQFDIVTDPANTGGLTLVTNEEQSGIYKRDEKTGELIRVETYEQPVVQLPYLRIIKQGLEVGESATFTVVKTLDAEGKEIDYTDQKYTAKVIITRKTEAEAEPYATLKLLHSGYYRVTESSWAWTYTPNGSTEQTKHLTTVKSSDETPNNIEYVFSNTKKKEGTSGYIEGAEDYIRNNLTTGKKIQPTVPSGGTEDDGSIN